MKNQKYLIKLVLSVFIFICCFCPAGKVFSADNTLNIVHLTDVHIDTKSKTTNKRMLAESVNLLQDAISQINKFENVDLVIFSGDVVNKPKEDEFKRFVTLANTLKFPWLYSTGNHDVGIGGGLSKARIIKVLNEKNPCFKQNTLYYSYCPNEKFLIIFMDGVIDNKITSNGYFPKEQLNWLEKQLRNNPDKKVIIVQHFPLAEPFKSDSHKITNSVEYMNIMEKYKNVAAVLSGHYHATKITEKNHILHINTPALVSYPNAFRQIKITSSGNKTNFDIKLVETNLKKVQQSSKAASGSPALDYGQEKDRSCNITITK